jgi:uncharacterized metal-binding protein
MKAPGSSSPRVVIVPCSGIGKTYGSVSREAAFLVTEDLRPAETMLVALSLLVLGDQDARIAVATHPCITLDGCKLACAEKMVQQSGGNISKSVSVLDVYRRHRDHKPKGIAELNQGGLDLARAMADDIVAAIDQLTTSTLNGIKHPSSQGQNGSAPEEDHAKLP